ncbi:bifunctional hydroxymethylpyrimidine kinase/phosphomethylpyrimidine kinase [Anaerostipes sp.]|uniref:bifunctional hydroxymethylpyrimidine kinase/phosphomethylpyrimidine kinase n=1 Tax=Anaerostipes sp. TaxID=1872530 RepID=UPI0025BC3F7C|nr:bifunctional hydroxymethylpyrimidine kinase/phosphomethylpyrimidine kinase [Anaerostipes sp.]MBS7008711.1 bifunctional hydroxymethylpyrimidine kinase/phosphomethylpyrimidine kinase [Anaerostipes sp.]
MKTVLTIAGSDCSGGAGIQADLKTMDAHGVYGMSAIAALTAQNTIGVADIYHVSKDFLEQQLDCIFTDIFPDAVKIGMIPEKELIQAAAEKLKEYDAKNIVLDPVMVSTSGSRLLSEDAIGFLKETLFPAADIITPNVPEAEVLSGVRIRSKEDMQEAAEKIGEYFDGYILVKGGHSVEDANDCLFYRGKKKIFRGTRVENENTHGTGCTLSSAIACNLAMGCDMETSIQNSKEYITGALLDGLDLGKGNGPLNHMYRLK